MIRRSPNSPRVKSGQGLSLILIKVLDYGQGTEIIICRKLAVYFLATIPPSLPLRPRNERTARSVLRRTGTDEKQTGLGKETGLRIVRIRLDL